MPYKIYREKVTPHNSKLGKIQMNLATLYVSMKIDPGKKFYNYYWMEGPLPGDQGQRITVLHYNQSQQCYHCLRMTDSGCQGLGHGKKCKDNSSIRAKMSEYMAYIKDTTDYVSLKEQYAKEIAK